MPYPKYLSVLDTGLDSAKGRAGLLCLLQITEGGHPSLIPGRGMLYSDPHLSALRLKRHSPPPVDPHLMGSRNRSRGIGAWPERGYVLLVCVRYDTRSRGVWRPLCPRWNLLLLHLFSRDPCSGLAVIFLLALHGWLFRITEWARQGKLAGFHITT